MTTHEPAPRPDDLVLARRAKGKGAFAGIDPSKPGVFWSRSRWVALFGWAATLGGALGVAYKQVGGLDLGKSQTDEPDESDGADAANAGSATDAQ